MKRIEIEWKGEAFSVEEREAFELGERIEEIVTLNELAQMANKPKFRKLARCYAEIINFAGGRATPAEIYSEMMNEIKAQSSEGSALIAAEAIGALIDILMDGAPEEEASDDGKKTISSSKAAT